jgi:hypothetical protein
MLDRIDSKEAAKAGGFSHGTDGVGGETDVGVLKDRKSRRQNETRFSKLCIING